MAHRKRLYPKLSAIATQLGTEFYLVEGDMVSYRGDKWLLPEVTGSPNQPMTARLQQAMHADAVSIEVVKYDTLRPLASMREKLLYTADVKATRKSTVSNARLCSQVRSRRSMQPNTRYTCTIPVHSINAIFLHGNARGSRI